MCRGRASAQQRPRALGSGCSPAQGRVAAILGARRSAGEGGAAPRPAPANTDFPVAQLSAVLGCDVNLASLVGWSPAWGPSAFRARFLLGLFGSRRLWQF